MSLREASLRRHAITHPHDGDGPRYLGISGPTICYGKLGQHIAEGPPSICRGGPNGLGRSGGAIISSLSTLSRAPRS